MFDTIHLKTPLLCPGCGAEQRSLQTKQLSDTMSCFKTGSVLAASPVLTGIVQEHLWCSACHQAGKAAESPVYLVIWHSVLAGVVQDLALAEARLAAVDRLDLIGWLDEAQREAERWRRRYHGLHHDVQRWSEHLARKAGPEPAGEDAEGRRSFCRLFDLPDEILNAPDPLAAILAANRHADEEADS